MFADSCKTKKVYDRTLYLHPIALMILFDMQVYTIENNLEFVVTETATSLQEDKQVGRKHSTHRTGRAFDLRNRSWSHLEIKDFENYFNNKYKRYAAISGDGTPNLIVSKLHGTGPHFHVQIHSKYSLNLNLSD